VLPLNVQEPEQIEAVFSVNRAAVGANFDVLIHLPAFAGKEEAGRRLQRDQP